MIGYPVALAMAAEPLRVGTPVKAPDAAGPYRERLWNRRCPPARASGCDFPYNGAIRASQTMAKHVFIAFELYILGKKSL